MKLLSSNERPGTGSPSHSSMGVPLAPNPLNRSSVRQFRSVVGAFVTDWDPATEFGSVARTVSAPTTKDITITNFSDFIYIPPTGWVMRGPIGKELFLEVGLISEEHYLHGARARRLGEPERRTPRVLIRQVMRSDLPTLARHHAPFYRWGIILGATNSVAKAALNCYRVMMDTRHRSN